MTAVSLLRDLAAFSVQIAIVVVVVAGLLRVVRIPARPRYLVLRLTLLACLLVPWTLRSVIVVTEAPASPTALQAPAPSASAASGTSVPAPGSSTGTGQPRDLPDLPWTALGLVGLIAGVTARVIWLAIGFFRLGQMTRRAVPVESPEYATVQEQLGTTATISEVDRLAQPVTFGFRRPVVLLPDSLAAAPAALRRAVVTHELFHVRRGDWLSLLGEEAVRAVLWFHPAIHWLMSSIQLAREEMVDELTVRATGDRRAYMQALLAFADTGALRTAPAFAHRRQLFHRILSVSKEKVMSAPRIVMSVAALAVGVSAASWYASSAFPILTASRIELPMVTVAPIDDGWLIAEPQFVTVAAPLQLGQVSGNSDEPNDVTPENPIPRRTRGASPAWPSQFAGMQNGVVVNTLVRIGRDGVVTNVFDRGCSVSQGRSDEAVCRAFFDASASAIRQWRYDRPVRGPLQFSVVVTFGLGGEAAVVQSPTAATDPLRETQNSVRLLAAETEAYRQRENELQARLDALRRSTDQLRELERGYKQALEKGSSPPHPDLVRLQEALERLADEMSRQQQTLRRSTWPTQIAAQLAQAEQAMLAYRSALEAARAVEHRGERALVSPSGRIPIRVADTPDVQPPAVTRRVDPQHPIVAMQARVSGTVILEVLVDERGNVADARVARSIPLLDQAALDAVKQWQFRPATLKGEAVPVIVQIEMNFTLR